MMKSLNQTFQEECNSEIQSFQLSGINLPDAFEQAIDDTEVERQMIITN
jgi:hypothetical protein